MDDQIDNAMSRQMTSESGVTQTFPDYKKAKDLIEKKDALKQEKGITDAMFKISNDIESKQDYFAGLYA